MSPGRPAAQAQGLQLVPARVDLIRGDTAELSPVVTWSDGSRSPLPRQLATEAQWLSPDSLVTRVGHRLRGVATGQARVELQAGGLTARAEVAVRAPLAEQLEFAPSWDHMPVSAGTTVRFNVLHDPGLDLRLSWRVAGSAESPAHTSQFVWERRDAATDTIEVRVRRAGGLWGREQQLTRRWVLTGNQAPQLQTPVDTSLIAGTPYTDRLRATDADGDAVVVLLDRGPGGLTLAPRRHEIHWTPSPSQVGSHQVQVRASDGRAAATATFVLTVRTAAARSTCAAAAWLTPNPFRGRLMVHLCRAPQTQGRLEIFDLRGRRVRQLTWPAGSRQLAWDGNDGAGRSVASGVYFLALRAAGARGQPPTMRQRALRLR